MLEALGALGGGVCGNFCWRMGGYTEGFVGLRRELLGGFGGGMPELNFGLRGGDFWGNGGGVCRDISGLWVGYVRTFGVCRKFCGLRGGYAGTVVR